MRYTFTVQDAKGEVVASNTVGESSIMGMVKKALANGHKITVHSSRYEKATRKP